MLFFALSLAQTPAPVSNINVISSSSSATVTWKLPASNRQFSYAAHIVIYLDNKRHSIQTRTTSVTLRNLKPSTQYKVGIQTQDIHSQQSVIMNEEFTTRGNFNIYFVFYPYRKENNALMNNWTLTLHLNNQEWNYNHGNYFVVLLKIPF